jgi:TRAP-type C4-dicarboxylate transport system permease small subunit
VDTLATGMAFLGGAFFLVIALYITLDVTGRRFLGVTTAVSDEIAGYALAFGGVWALAYTLRTGGHVRIDVVLPYLPPRLRWTLNALAMAVMGVFSTILGYYGWALAIQSYRMEAKAMSHIQTPVWVPQALVAVGFSALTLEAALLLGAAVVESCLSGRLVPLAALPAPGAEEREPEEPA